MALISSSRTAVAAAAAAALLLFALGSNALHFIERNCSKNFINNESLQRGINNALLEMVGRSSISGYAAISSGGDYSAIFSLTWCRGDISAAACSACVTTAAQRIREVCPDSAEARIWYDLCFLRYEDRNFIGKADTSYAGAWTSANIARDPQAFDQQVGELMGEVTAAASGGRKRFGWGKTFDAADSVTLYGMAQCTRDLDDSECCKCLDAALQIVSTECRCRLGCYVVATSCVLRYENYQFLRYRPQQPPALAPAPSFN